MNNTELSWRQYGKEHVVHYRRNDESISHIGFSMVDTRFGVYFERHFPKCKIVKRHQVDNKPVIVFSNYGVFYDITHHNMLRWGQLATDKPTYVTITRSEWEWQDEYEKVLEYTRADKLEEELADYWERYDNREINVFEYEPVPLAPPPAYEMLTLITERDVHGNYTGYWDGGPQLLTNKDTGEKNHEYFSFIQSEFPGAHLLHHASPTSAVYQQGDNKLTVEQVNNSFTVKVLP